MNNTEEKISVEIVGLTCDGCSRHVERDVSKLNGISEANVDFKSGKGEFTFDSALTSNQEIVETINNIGNYKVVGEKVEKPSTKEVELNKNGDAKLKTDFDLIIIGGGSAAFSAMTTASGLGKKTMMVNGGLDIGGTCVNVGCVPSKFLIRAGESIHNASHSPFEGVEAIAPKTDFQKIIQQKKELVSQLREKKYLNVFDSVENVTRIDGWANFVNKNTIEINGEKYSAQKILISTGASTNIPEIEGLEQVGYLTNISLFDLEKKPESLTILGAGYIGLEIAQAYARLGVKVRIVEYSKRLLRSQNEDVSKELETQFKKEGITLYPNFRIKNVRREGDEIIMEGKMGPNNISLAEKGHLVVATGTKPNTHKMSIENAGVELTESGHIKVNNKQETNIANIYAAGDCSNTPAFVYTAALEGKNAMLNAFDNQDLRSDYTAMPWVVFTDPQVAGVGLDEKEADAFGLQYDVTTLPLSEVPRAMAALDTRGFIKLLRTKSDDRIIGARVVAPEGGELIMEAAMAVKYGIRSKDLAEMLHPYLTLSEGIKIAAITFEKDISELSCCAT